MSVDNEPTLSTQKLNRNRLSRSTPNVNKLCQEVDDMKLKNPNTSNVLVPPPRLSALAGTHGKVFPASEPSSRMSSAQFYKKRMTDVVVQIPASQLKKLRESDLGSYHRETKHFCDTTTMHGPKRVYRGKQCSLLFWSFMFIASILFLCLQVYSLVNMYISKPTVSQVSFQINDNGVEFPVITICPFNPIKKSAISQLNKTGDFPEELLGYLLETNVEAPALYSSSNMDDLAQGEKLLQQYKKNHPEFNMYTFFKEYGFSCTDIMRWCTFGGRKFDCCSVAKSVLTTMGKCQRIDIRSSGLDWMQKQKTAGANAGLQLILDSHQEEQFLNENGIVSPSFETGFRYYIHDNVTVPYLASEGISVSPGMRVYSALSTNKYVLLDTDNWGHCIHDWPSNYNMAFPYSAATCSAKCKALFFFNNCGCSPSAYDVEDKYPICSPVEVVRCIDTYMYPENATDFELPQCAECKIECNSNIYQTFNSYGQEFSAPSLRWLNKKNSSWSPELIKKNFLTINVFFRDLSHTEYTQVQASSLTELFSNIGGNMGMFLGMSTITITEITLFLCKLFWIAFSKRRRSYMAEKKKREEAQDKEVFETVKEFKRIRSCQDISSINCKPMDHYICEQPFNINVPQLSIESCNSSISGTETTEMTDRWKASPSP